MKVLTIRQPWAELILEGKKTIELRSWNTNLRGEFLIHSSGNVDGEAMKRHKLFNLQRQAIIGKANLKDVKEYKDEKDFLKDKDKHLNSIMGKWKFGFILENPQRITPIKIKGKLGFWDFVGEK